MRWLTLFTLLALVAFVTACDRKVDSPLSLTDRPSPAFVVSNWKAIKLPIHTALSSPTVAWAYYGDPADHTVDTCHVQTIRATAYDANNRQIADSLGTWSSLDPSLLVVDDTGAVRPATCWKDARGFTVLMDTTVGVVFTLRQSK